MRSDGSRLKICILISLAGHIFWLWLVEPVFLSKEFKPLHFSSVSFLGSILMETSLEPMPTSEVGKSPYTYQEAVMHHTLSKQKALHIEKPMAPDRPEEKAFQEALAKEVKASPLGMFRATDERIEGKKIHIDGPAGERALLYRPEPPRYPGWWLKDIRYTFDMRLKFWVSPSGKVSNVKVLTSSGYPEIDLVGVRYLRGWRFEALADNEPQRNIWGTVELRFKYRQ